MRVLWSSNSGLELTLGLQAGVATPALAERVGRWAAEHTQRQGLEMLQQDHGVHWSCATLRKLLSSLSAGMAPSRRGRGGFSDPLSYAGSALR